MKIIIYILYALILLLYGTNSIYWVMQRFSVVQYTTTELSSGLTAFYIMVAYAHYLRGYDVYHESCTLQSSRYTLRIPAAGSAGSATECNHPRFISQQFDG